MTHRLASITFGDFTLHMAGVVEKYDEDSNAILNFNLPMTVSPVRVSLLPTYFILKLTGLWAILCVVCDIWPVEVIESQLMIFWVNEYSLYLGTPYIRYS